MLSYNWLVISRSAYSTDHNKDPISLHPSQFYIQRYKIYMSLAFSPTEDNNLDVFKLIDSVLKVYTNTVFCKAQSTLTHVSRISIKP